MSADKHKFPDSRYSLGCIFPSYDKFQVDDWFKRCIEDFPQYPVIGRGDPWTHREYEAWFKKWFSQFRNKC